jgi:hypothetical protein
MIKTKIKIYIKMSEKLSEKLSEKVFKELSEKVSEKVDNSKNLNKTLHELDKKIKHLQDIRHEIKKKRVLFDENKERFGLDELSQLTKVKNTSEVKGYPFRGSRKDYLKITKGINIGLKVVPIETKYDKREHPCNLENLVLKHLTEHIVNKNISPHVAYYLGTQKVTNKSKALKMLNLKRLEVEEKIRTHSNMLISEFVEGGSLDNWIYEIYEEDNEITDEQWKSIVFQLLYTIAIIQHYYKMMHNDFHYGNILIDDSIKPGGYLVYDINNKRYYIKNTGVIPKLWDFEFCMVYSDKIPDCYPNKFILGPYQYDKKNHKTIVDPSVLDEPEEPEDINVPFNYNEVYDVHYFLTSLLDLYISQELYDWIIQLYPRELIPDEEESSSYSTSETKSTTTSETKSTTTSDTTTSDTTTSDTTSETKSKTTRSSESKSRSSESKSRSSESESRSSESELESIYLAEGRLVNGTEEKFKLPSPIDLLNAKFFELFTKKPDDFDEKDALYFKAGF